MLRTLSSNRLHPSEIQGCIDLDERYLKEAGYFDKLDFWTQECSEITF